MLNLIETAGMLLFCRNADLHVGFDFHHFRDLSRFPLKLVYCIDSVGRNIFKKKQKKKNIQHINCVKVNFNVLQEER